MTAASYFNFSQLEDSLLDHSFKITDQFRKSFLPTTELEESVIALYEKLVLLELDGKTTAHAHFCRTVVDNLNIHLLHSLLAFHYISGHTQAWRNLKERVQDYLIENASLIPFLVQAHTEILLAKLHEEDGCVVPALTTYQRLCEEAKAQKHYELYICECLPQVLRLQAGFGLSRELGQVYTELLTVRRSLLLKGNMIEIEHSLMLAEMALVGSSHAWARTEGLVSDPLVPMKDRRLVLYDFIEEQILKRKLIPPRAQEWALTLSGHDAFERLVHEFAFENPKESHFAKIAECSAQLSAAAHLRLLALYSNLFADTATQAEAQNLAQLLISSLDLPSQKYWANRMPGALTVQKTRLKVDLINKVVSFHERSADLSKKRSLMGLLETLTQSRTLSSDEAIETLWQLDYSPEAYHRLRMTVHRLNQIIFELTNMPKAIEISADYVGFRPSFDVDLFTP